MSSTKPHDRILDAAIDLFSREGVHAVGVQRIVDEADVAPMTVYRQFGGKDALVAAALEHWSIQWFDWLLDEIDRRGDDPKSRFAGLWDALETWIRSEPFRGSLVENAAIEFRGRLDHPAQRVIATHRMAVHQLLEDLAKLAGAHHPTGMADRLQVLIDGSITAALIGRRPAVAARDVRLLAGAVFAADSA